MDNQGQWQVTGNTAALPNGLVRDLGLSPRNSRATPAPVATPNGFETQFVAEQGRVKIWQRHDCWRLPPNVKTESARCRIDNGPSGDDNKVHSSRATHPLAYRPLCAQSQ